MQSLRKILDVLYVPVKDSETSEPNSPSQSPTEDKPVTGSIEDSNNDQHGTSPRSPTGSANISLEAPLLQPLDKLVSRGPGLAARQSPDHVKMASGGSGLPHALSEEEASTLNEECVERFIKVNVKYITDGQGVVGGVLLVTSNAIMFDPNVSDPLVLENGTDAYGVTVPMDTIMSAAIYHDITAMKLSNSNKEPASQTNAEYCHHEVYHSADGAVDKTRTKDSIDFSMKPQQNTETEALYGGTEPTSDGTEPTKTEHSESVQKSTGELMLSDNGEQIDSQTTTCTVGSDQTSQVLQKLTQSELSVVSTETKDSDVLYQKPESDEVSMAAVTMVTEQKDSPAVVSSAETLDLPHLELTVGNKDDGGSEGGSVESGIAEMHDDPSPLEEGEPTKSPPSSSSPMPYKKIENVTYSPYDDDVNQEKASSEEKTENDIDKVKDNAEASPTHNTGAEGQKSMIRRTIGSLTSQLAGSPKFSGMFARSQDEQGCVKDVSEVDLAVVTPKSEAQSSKSDAQSPSRSQRKSSSQDRKQLDISMENVIKLNDKPGLFQALDELIPKPTSLFEDLPLYLCLRVGKLVDKKATKTESDSKTRRKSEFWFSIPKERVDPLYAFFVQWSPNIYGADEEIDLKERGFVVVDDLDDEEEELDIVDEHSTGARLIRQVSKDWEIVKVEETRRQLSLVENEPLPLPEMSSESSILTEQHVRTLNELLPPRTVGYPWSLIYSTDKHGFSLKSLYRLMPGVDSPVLLVVKDTQNNVFGALVSCPLHVSDHFYGTGESFLFTFHPEFKKFDWTGENNFFIKGNLNSLCIGASQGVYGLWVDGDIYHGHTQKCATYNNDVLTSKEDFVVKGLEAWGFE